MAIINSGSRGSGTTLGSSILVYRYTVAGSAKASIDTGVDTPQAGANDWTNGDLLEVFMYARTDEAVPLSQVDVILNNDTGGNYDLLRTRGTSATTLAYANSFANTAMFANAPGASLTASVFGYYRMVIPAFTGTTGQKILESMSTVADTTNTNSEWVEYGWNYRSASAVTRLKVIPHTAAKNFVVGSQLLIYKRSSA